MDKLTLLRRCYGHEAFRPGQEELVDAILAGQDVLGIMPTGGGKSVCYQIPALLLSGLTLVVSPLISLMKDQVLALREMGVAAAYINSSLSGEEARQVYRSVREGRCRLLYIAPERLCMDGFLQMAQSLSISLLAVDEAHCISQWGQDFRPSYLKIPEFLEALPRRPTVAAFTATATEQVQQDIERYLHLRSPHRVVTGFDRPNLFFDVLHPKHKEDTLLELVQTRPHRSGIVYCATRKAVETVCDALRRHGIRATRYHAGLEPEERQRNQDDFLYDRAEVMVATNAFGMGIDKSNVSYVIHYNMPRSMEAYYQEAGRAGRDGTQAECFLLYAPRDVQTAQFMIEHSGDENDELTPRQHAEIMHRDKQRLQEMIGYCRTSTCLRGRILGYFGQAHPVRCTACGNCRASLEAHDITREAQMILSCVKRIQDALGYAVGTTLLLQTLRGSQDKHLLERKLDSLSTYGLLQDRPEEQVRRFVERLEELGYLQIESEHHSVLLTSTARAVLFRGEKVVIWERRKSVKKHTAAPQGGPLYDALRQLRTEIAQEEGIAPFMVFSNATLEDMAKKKPRTTMDFRRVNGVGEVKANRYAKRFVACIKDFEA